MPATTPCATPASPEVVAAEFEHESSVVPLDASPPLDDELPLDEPLPDDELPPDELPPDEDPLSGPASSSWSERVSMEWEHAKEINARIAYEKGLITKFQYYNLKHSIGFLLITPNYGRSTFPRLSRRSERYLRRHALSHY